MGNRPAPVPPASGPEAASLPGGPVATRGLSMTPHPHHHRGPSVPPRAAAFARLGYNRGDTRIRPKGPGGRARRGGPGRGGARGGGGSGAGGVPGWVGTALAFLAARLGPMDALCGSGEFGSKFWVRRCLGSESAPRRASETALGRGPSDAGRVSDRALRAGPSGRPDTPALPCPPPPRGGAGAAGRWAPGAPWVAFGIGRCPHLPRRLGLTAGCRKGISPSATGLMPPSRGG